MNLNAEALLILIADYLDPISLSKLKLTSTYFQKTINMYQNNLYKKFCIEIIKFQKNLPEPSVFTNLLMYIA